MTMTEQEVQMTMLSAVNNLNQAVNTRMEDDELDVGSLRDARDDLDRIIATVKDDT